MYENQIGTDGTIPTHIETNIKREYLKSDKTQLVLFNIKKYMN